MYGLVNKAVEQMARQQFGDDIWNAIKLRSKIDVDVFLNMTQYSDDVTYKLVAAASEVLQISPEQVLEAFGRYWVLYTAREGYGDLMTFSGSTLKEFLFNLDALHARVGLSYRALHPPSFECTDVEESSMLLHYRSSREGLSYLVVGLVKGLGERFQTPVEVEILEMKSAGADHDIFRLTVFAPKAL